MSTFATVPGAAVRRGMAILVLASAALLVTVAAAPQALAASVKLGQNKQNYFCSARYQWIQTASTSASYTAPAKGKLTRWMVLGGPNAGKMQFEVWRPAAGGDYVLRYISPRKSLTAGVLTRVRLTPQVAVKAGDVIGLRSVTRFDCAFRTDDPADTYVYNINQPVPVVGDTVHFIGGVNGFQFNVAALFS